jgi:hypothetical protein
MSGRIIEIVKSPSYAGEMYEIQFYAGSVSYSLGLYRFDDLLHRLREMTFSDGSTPERLVEAVTRIQRARAEVDWPAPAGTDLHRGS